MITPTSIERDISPASALDYSLDYVGELSTGETITTSTWEVTTLSGTSTADITLSGEQISGTITSVFVTGGVRGTVYNLINHIETSNTPSRKFSRHFVLSCKLL